MEIENTEFVANGVKTKNTLEQSKPLKFHRGKRMTTYYGTSVRPYHPLNVSGDPYSERGGAIICCQHCTLLSTNNTFRNNSANNKGGAIFVCQQAKGLIENSTFKNNFAPSGGAIHAENNSSLTITLSILKNNEAILHGGAIFLMFDNKLNISQSVFDNNSVYQQGAAVDCIHKSIVFITSCLFKGNVVNIYYSGALSIAETNLTLSNSNFTKNQAGQTGGGAIVAQNFSHVDIENCQFNDSIFGAIMVMYYGTLNVTNTQFFDNRQSDYGAAILALDIQIELNFVDFVNNTASHGGALVTSRSSSLVAKNCCFRDNAAYFSGGAVHIESQGNVTLENITFKSNTAGAGTGGAMSISEAPVKMKVSSCYFVDNHSVGNGGAVYLSDKSTLLIQDSIFTQNKAQGGGAAIALSNSNLQARNIPCTKNIARGNDGGAISAEGPGFFSIKNSDFIENKVLWSGNGGAITIAAGIGGNLEDVVFLNNYADGSAGAIAVDNSSLELSRGYFYENSNKRSYGGAMTVLDGSLFIAYNSTFQNSIADIGGCIHAQNSDVLMENCFVNNNTVPDHHSPLFALSLGGAFFVEGANIALSNCLLSDNLVYSGESLYLFATASTSIRTYQSTFISTKNITLESSESNFTEKAVEDNLITQDGGPIRIQETPYASCMYFLFSLYTCNI